MNVQEKTKSSLRAFRLFLFFVAPALFPFPNLSQIINAPPVPEWIIPSPITLGQPAHFRKSFHSPPGLLKAILHGACRGKMTVYLNGRPIAEISGGDAASSADITQLLKQGPNLLAIRAESSAQIPAVAVLLELNADLAPQTWIASDAAWPASVQAPPDWFQPSAQPPAWPSARSLGKPEPEANPFDARKSFDAYNSWKLALAANTATAADSLALLPGFKAQLIRSALPDEGSWVAMAFDPQGRLTIAREKRGLIRLTFNNNAAAQVEVINDTLLECRGLLYAHQSLYAHANNTKALFRLRDPNDNGSFPEITQILRTEGGVGHARNHLKLGPDGRIYLAFGNNVLLPSGLLAASPLRPMAEDQLIPCPWDPHLFDGDVLAPAGFILSLDPGGRQPRLVAGGFRNPLDIAFNSEGELFTFDADMEWDLSAPWYMPNRVLHIVSGADFGFRRGTGRFPDYYPDTWPSVADIGLASPTAALFGAGARFPKKYQDALYVCDWAYGRILAVHLEPHGASYRGSFETFVSGRPLNVTDAAIGPDGAFWFVTGGRGTQSGLYRVTFAEHSPAPPPIASEDSAQQNSTAALRAIRRGLERFHHSPPTPDSSAIAAEIWPFLGHDDFWIRQAARVALELQPPALWRSRALEETALPLSLTALLALARAGEPSDQSALLRRLAELPFASLNEPQQLTVLRIHALSFIRQGPPSPEAKKKVLALLEPLYPAPATRLNRELCELLVYLASPAVLPKTLPLLSAATASEDLIHYPFFLRYVREGWTPEARAICFAALDRAQAMQGARQYFKAIQDIRREMIDALSPSERQTLEPWISKASPAAPPIASFVQDWRLSDLNDLPSLKPGPESAASGRAAFISAQCALCHRMGSDPSTAGGVAGPDLTGVSGRFNRRDLLEHILSPSKFIDEKFLQTTLRLRDGTVHTGTIEREDNRTIALRAGPLASETIAVPKDQIEARDVSAISPMPEGLLNSLTKQQISDLLTFLETSDRAEGR